MRKITLVSIVAMLALVLSLSFAFAAEEEITVYLDGEEISLTTDAVLENGRALVPFRSIFEALGLEVGWDEKTWTATGTAEGTEITLTIDSEKAIVNGEEKTLDVAPALKNGSTMIPLRFVAEAAGCNVEWIDTDWQVKIWSVDENAASLMNQINEANAVTGSTAMTLMSKVSAVAVEAGETTTLDMDIVGDMKMVVDGEDVKLAMTMKMKTVENGEPEEMDVEYYFADGVMYMIMDGEKVKLAMETEEAKAQMNVQPIDTAELKYDDNTIKGSKVEELADGGYRLTFVMNADTLNDVMEASFQQSLALLEELELDNVEVSMTYSDMMMEVVVDKELKMVSSTVRTACDAVIGQDTMAMDLYVSMTVAGDQEVTITAPADLDSYQDFVEYMQKLQAAAEAEAA